MDNGNLVDKAWSGKTVRDLATNKYFVRARAIYLAAGEDRCRHALWDATASGAVAPCGWRIAPRPPLPAPVDRNPYRRHYTTQPSNRILPCRHIA